MRFPFPAMAVAIGCIAAPALAQDAAPDAVARIEAMTCREFLAFDAGDQATVKAAMLAHASGDPLPDTPLPGAAAADAAKGSQTADAAPAPKPVPKPASAGAAGGDTDSGTAAPDGTEASVTDQGGDRRLVAMRTSCEGGPDALAMNALRAAFGNNL